MPPVIVVGAGLAGLNCARILRRSGKRVILLEAADRPGGLVATDTVRGHRIDRGFQVLQAAYPEANAALHYGSLRLRPFYPGALLRHGSRWRLFADPWRRPVASLASLFGGPGGLMDRLRVGWLRLGVSAERLDRLLSRPDMKTREMLRRAGFSDGFISGFFRPLFAGIFLEPDLDTSRRVFDFVFRMMALGPVCLPEGGMGQISSQLAMSLPRQSIWLDSPVGSIEAGGVRLASGRWLDAGAVVVACENPSLTGLPERQWLPVTQVAFTVEKAPLSLPILALNGDGSGPVNHLAVPSLVAAGYAPTGRHIVSANVVGERARDDDARLLPAVARQMAEWFGPQAASWEVIAVHRVMKALPAQNPGSAHEDGEGTMVRGVRVLRSGAHPASIHGALRAGRLAAEAILRKGR